MRLDVYLSESGLLRSRTVAKEYIGSGRVTVNGDVVTKPSFDVSDSDSVALSSPPPEFVSRGGVKLEAALEAFGISVEGAVCCDIGSSTGGFTDCLLRRGAKTVYAVDSGRGQLDPSLLSDPRVVSVEGFNARDLSPDVTGGLCDVVVADVSFISQTYVIPPAVSVMKSGAVYIGLIKPQFECGRAALGKGGIVRDEKTRRSAVGRVTECAERCGLDLSGVITSPITGGDGNVEYLFSAVKKQERGDFR